MTTLAQLTENLRAAAADVPPSAQSLKIALIDEGVVRLHNGQVDNIDGPADCTVFVAKPDLEAMAAGTLDPTAAFMAGKLRIDGDVGVAMALQSVLGRALG
jgi:putative sterol carrier protein